MKAIAKALRVDGEINLGDYYLKPNGSIDILIDYSYLSKEDNEEIKIAWEKRRHEYKKCELFAVISDIKPGDTIVCHYNGNKYIGKVYDYYLSDEVENNFDFENNPFYGSHIAEPDLCKQYTLTKEDGSPIYKMLGKISTEAKFVNHGEEIEVDLFPEEDYYRVKCKCCGDYK